MKKRSLRILLGSTCLILLLLASAFIAVAAPATPEKPILLRFSTHFPPAHPRSIIPNRWMDNIEKATNNRVKFERYYSETLVGQKDAWDELLKGTTDIVLILGGTFPGRGVMPIQSMIGIAFVGVKDMQTCLRIYTQVCSEFPELAAEWARVKILGHMGAEAFQIHSIKPVRTLADLKGMQIRGIGAWPKNTAEKLGASLIAVPTGEMYIALQKRIIDGCFHAITSLEAFKLAEVVKNTTLLDVYHGVSERVCMNLDSWKKLPPDIQKIFDDNRAKFDEDHIKMSDEVTKSGEAYAKKLGHQFISLSQADLSTIIKLLAEEPLSAAKELDTKGLPGTKIYNRIQKLIAESK